MVNMLSKGWLVAVVRCRYTHVPVLFKVSGITSFAAYDRNFFAVVSTEVVGCG